MLAEMDLKTETTTANSTLPQVGVTCGQVAFSSKKTLRLTDTKSLRKPHLR